MEFSPKLAEFFGIMLGDGDIGYPKNPRIKISLNSICDKDYLLYVKKLCEELFNTKVIVKHRKSENTSEIYLFERKVIRLIINDLGLVPSPKWERAKIPSWIFENSFEADVLRGYFDTDGCFVRTNNNGTLYPRLEMKICPSPMQDQFIQVLTKLSFKFGVYEIGKGQVRVQMNGKGPLVLWKNLIGFSNVKHRNKLALFL